MATRNQTSIEGALYELVARGVKDTYFIKDDKEAVHPFQWTYDRYPASLPEERATNPLNEPRFGQRCEFEFDLPGDVLVEAYLEINLPSWLPPEMQPYNLTAETYVEEGLDKIYYGYTNGIGYFLLEKIQIFQDKILLQEVSGDSLYAASLNKGSWNQGFLTQQLAGVHDGSPISVMHNATPGTLKVNIPMIGCSWKGDKGLPLCGLRNQTFRLRLQLRTLDQLVESTDSTDYAPAPWTKRFTQDRDGLVLNVEANAIEKSKIGQPSIVLKTKQLYLSNEAREQLAKEPAEVAYIRYFDNAYSINQLDYAPLDKGSGANLIKFLDANYTVERIISYFRSTSNILRNRLWDFSNSLAPDGQFYNSLQLTIAGRTREGPWEPDVWTSVITDAKEERNPARNIAMMNWSRGWRIEDEPPAIREPTGGINFTTADRPMLTIGLNDVAINPILGYKQTQLICSCETWALYRIRNGRGGLEYAN
jgi:hypothetical protein